VRVMWVGTYERAYPRTRVLIEGLRALGVEVVEHHRPLWERQEHKTGGFLGAGSLARAALGHLAAWAALPFGAVRGPRPDVVVAGYPAQPDVVPAWLLARTTGAVLVADMMISLADTLAGDRGLAGRRAGALLAGVDRVTLRLADIVLCDTHAHALFFHERFGVPWAKLVVAPVGAEAGAFPVTPPPAEPPVALFYGKLSPLHGLATVLEAARMPGVPPVRLIGDGQLGDWLGEELRRDPPPGVRWDRWVPYERLGEEVSRAAICLGVFGTSAKAARVVPNKVWQAMAAGRPVISADTPGIREAVTDGVSGLLVPAGDAAALAGAMRALAADPVLRARMGEAARAAYLEKGAPAAAAAPLHEALRARFATLPPR
jgi:glycosyltransferase involved in cell wall biosynthesis